MELVGVHEAAVILGIKVKTNVRHIKNLPKPIAELRCGPIWDKQAIEAFARKRPRSVRRNATDWTW